MDEVIVIAVFVLSCALGGINIGEIYAIREILDPTKGPVPVKSLIKTRKLTVVLALTAAALLAFRWGIMAGAQ